MSDALRPDGPEERIAAAAAAWVLRADRGLTADEQDAFSEWLAADHRHGPALARHRRHWGRLDRLAEWRPEHGARPNPDLLAVPLRQRLLSFAPAVGVLAAAASVVLAWLLWPASESARPSVSDAARPVNVVAAEPGPRILEDGSIVELNRGAAIAAEYGAHERRVRLERGEAHFAVTKDSTRPFIVEAGGVEVRAVGTAFNVRVDTGTVEVLVTEGRVRLETGAAEGAAGAARPEPRTLVESLTARQRAVVSGAAPAPEIATLTVGEIERVLAWQHKLLDFTSVPLRDIVAELNRRNLTQLVVVDPELAATRVSAQVRSDNLAGFVRLLEAGFGAQAERRGETEIVLRRAR